MQKDLGMKWLKVCKILWLIGAALSFYSIWVTLISSTIVFSAFPVYTVVSAVFSIVSVILTILAYTAVSSFCASRFKYIIALFIIMPVSAAVSAYGNVIAEDFGAKLIVSGGCFLIVALAWSLPNIIYFMHRKQLFTGADPDSDAKETSSISAEDEPQHVGGVHKVKVTPIRVSPNKSTDKNPAVAEGAKNKKPILTYSLAVLCLALVVLCAYQSVRIAELKGQPLPWEKNETVLVPVSVKSERYHNGNCPLSRQNMMRKVSKKEAIAEGYKECYICFG